MLQLYFIINPRKQNDILFYIIKLKKVRRCLLTLLTVAVGISSCNILSEIFANYCSLGCVTEAVTFESVCSMVLSFELNDCWELN